MLGDKPWPADDRLWCMHVSGSDDVHPAPDRATAQLWAAQFMVANQQRNPTPHPYDPVTNFMVAEWPWSAEDHAASLERSIADNTWPVDPLTAPTVDAADAGEGRDHLREAAQAVLDRMFGTYKARNGRDVGIEGDDGEKCWIVHSDDIETLRRALAQPTPDTREGGPGYDLAEAMRHEARLLRAFWCDDSGTSLHLNAADLLDKAAGMIPGFAAGGEGGA